MMITNDLDPPGDDEPLVTVRLYCGCEVETTIKLLLTNKTPHVKVVECPLHGRKSVWIMTTVWRTVCGICPNVSHYYSDDVSARNKAIQHAVRNRMHPIYVFTGSGEFAYELIRYNEATASVDAIEYGGFHHGTTGHSYQVRRDPRVGRSDAVSPIPNVRPGSDPHPSEASDLPAP